MHIRVFGTTEIDGAPALGSGRQRRLLAILAMKSPTAVPRDTLVESVWNGELPDRGSAALRTVVSRLRGTLDNAEAGGAKLLVSHPHGYALEVRSAEIDAHRFAELVEVGQRQLREGEAESARATFRDATALWSGAPYAEFADEAWATVEVARLKRLLRSCREADVEARMQCGLHADVIDTLPGLIADDPYSDALRAVQMRAEFALGRQAAALRVAREYRQLLADEVGLQPGPGFVALERRILDGDPMLVPDGGRPLRGYRLYQQLAQTEFGAHYRATHPDVSGGLVVETIVAPLADDPEFVRRFDQRLRAISRLDHAHVVPVLDFWRDPGTAYAVRPAMPGGSLANSSVADGLSRTALADARRRIASALEAAEAIGVAHGQLLPGDVVFDDAAHAFLRISVVEPRELKAPQAELDRLFQRFARDNVGPDPVDAPKSEVPNPFRGLAVFSEADSDVYFGRDPLVEEVLDTLDRTGAAVVVGPSGSGKSSLVRAGVLPALGRGRLSGSADWFVITMTAGARPFDELESAVLRVAAHRPSGLREQLLDPDEPWNRVIRRLMPDPDVGVVLFIDQFEEMFTQTPDAERLQFLEALGRITTSGDHRGLRVIATLRADHFHLPLSTPSVAPLFKRSAVTVDALTGDELRATIVEPARHVGVDVEADLVGRLVGDASSEPGGLPLLEFSLTRLFEERATDVITLDAYVGIGGLTAAIGDRAEEVYRTLSPAQQEACRRLFGRLTIVGGGTDPARRRASFRELWSVEEDPTSVDEIARRFVDARLLATDRDPATRDPTLEVTHEALFHEWPRLAGWLEEDRQALLSLRHLAAASEGWNASSAESELYRGARLAGALELLESHGDRLTADEREFIVASRDREERDRQTERRRNRRLRVLLVAAVVLGVVATVAGSVAIRSRDEATRERDAADAERFRSDVRRLVAESANQLDVDRTRALLLAKLAHDREPSTETLGALQRALVGLPAGWLGRISTANPATEIELVPGRDQLAALTEDGVVVYDLGTGLSEPGLLRAGASSIDVTADGDRIVVAGTDGEWEMYELPSWQEVGAGRARGNVTVVAFSPDSAQIALGLRDGTVEIVDTATAGPVALVDGLRDLGVSVADLAWDPTGSRLLVAGGDSHPARLFDVGQLEQVGPDLWARGAVTEGSAGVGFDGRDPVVVNEIVQRFDANTLGPASPIDPDSVARGVAAFVTDLPGPLMLIGDAQGTVEIVNFETGSTEVVVRDGQSSAANGLAYDPLSRTVAMAGTAGIDIWSIDGDRVLGSAVRTEAPKVSIDPTGRYVALSPVSLEGELLVWDLELGEADLESADWAFANHREGKMLTGAPEAQAVWSPGAGRPDATTTFPSVGPAVTNQALSPDGRWYAVASRLDRSIHLVDLTTDERVVLSETKNLLPPTAPEFAGIPNDIEFDPAGTRLIATLFGGSRVVIWNTSTWDLNQPMLADEDAFLDIDFRADGAVAVTATIDGRIAVRDTDDLNVIAGPVAGPIETTHSGHAVAISDDGELIAQFGRTGAVLWDAATLRPIGDPFPHASPQGWAGAMATAGKRIVTLVDGFAVSWEVDTARWPGIACAAAGRSLSTEEWTQWAPVGDDFELICPHA